MQFGYMAAYSVSGTQALVLSLRQQAHLFPALLYLSPHPASCAGSAQTILDLHPGALNRQIIAQLIRRQDKQMALSLLQYTAARCKAVGAVGAVEAVGAVGAVEAVRAIGAVDAAVGAVEAVDAAAGVVKAAWVLPLPIEQRHAVHRCERMR